MATHYVRNGNGPRTVNAMIAALTHTPLAAGTGAFGGLLSTSWQWVAVDVLVSIVCGALLGLLTVRPAKVLSAAVGLRCLLLRTVVRGDPDAWREAAP